MTVYHQFSDVPTEIMDDLERAAEARLFSCRDWYENYVRSVVGREEQVVLVSVQEAGSSALLPLCRSGSGSFPAPRVLSSLANFYTTHFDLLYSDNDRVPEDIIAAIAGEISALRPRADRLDISPVDSAAEWLPALAEALREGGWMTQQYRCFKNLYLENTYDDFASYLKSRSSRIRKTAANRMRKFDRDGNNSFRFLTSADDLDEGLQVFSQLYEGRWRKAEPYPEFLPGLARLCAERGWLRMGLAFVGERPAAAQFWIVRNGVAYIFKVAYDEQFTKLSVGTLALFKMFEYVMNEDSVELIDFLTGDEPYKRDWMDQSRDMVGLAAFSRRSVKGLLGGIYNVGGSALKRRLRKSDSDR